ncbi:MAG: cupredoxin domain-containing protein [Polyangiales bacterium]
MRLALATLAIAFAVPTLSACHKTNVAESSAAASAPVVSDPIVGRRVDVNVGPKGFVPASIDLKKGEAATLVFTRTTTETCATEVVFPELKIKRSLPMQTPIAIQVPVGEAKTYGFECGMGMYKSKVVVQ